MDVYVMMSAEHRNDERADLYAPRHTLFLQCCIVLMGNQHVCSEAVSMWQTAVLPNGKSNVTMMWKEEVAGAYSEHHCRLHLCDCRKHEHERAMNDSESSALPTANRAVA